MPFERENIETEIARIGRCPRSIGARRRAWPGAAGQVLMQRRQIVCHLHLGGGGFAGRIGFGEQGVGGVSMGKLHFRVGEHYPQATGFGAGSALCRGEGATRQVRCTCPVSGAVERHRTVGRGRALRRG